ncbi:SufD family Fe-S cluster assembly protein [Patescibacteria group bacterium]|nr:SufD family Fe-S cluster assembly protein [Patescibacteria group bacterium]
MLQENLLLGKQLTLKSKPQLDVHSHDVSASHGARFESFDANKIFYMTAK